MKKVIYKRSKKYWTFTIRIKRLSIERSTISSAFSLCLVLLSISLLFQKNYFFTSVSAQPYSPTFLQKISSPGVKVQENIVSLPKSSGDPVVFHGPRDKKQVALTFDADMTYFMREAYHSGEVKSYVDEKTINILNHTQTKATMFLTGLWIEMYPQVTVDLANNPLFELGNHSYSHPGFDGVCYGLTPVAGDQKIDELEKTQLLLKKVANVDSTLFRFPGGCYSQKDAKLVEEKKLRPIQWDVAGQDGFNDNAESIEKNVVDNVQDGSIIVLHMNGYPNEPKTAEVLPKIIETLKERGYEFVKVSELLHPTQTASLDLFKQYKLN